MARPLITSVHNQRVKDAAKLRERRQREKQGRTLIDGGREIQRAIQAGIELVEVFLCDGFCYENQFQPIVAALEDARIAVLPCAPEVFAKVAYGERADGIVAVAATPRRSLDDLKLTAPALVAVLVGLEKPGNVGAVLRSADAAGVAAVIVADGGTDLHNPNAIRASLGTIFSLPVCEATTSETLAWLRTNNVRVFAARVDGAIDYTAADFSGSSAIILGSEKAGLRKDWQDEDISAIKLPMHGVADSLNVSATAAVLFYEALRQRSHFAPHDDRLGLEAPRAGHSSRGA